MTSRYRSQAPWSPFGECRETFDGDCPLGFRRHPLATSRALRCRRTPLRTAQHRGSTFAARDTSGLFGAGLWGLQIASILSSPDSQMVSRRLGRGNSRWSSAICRGRRPGDFSAPEHFPRSTRAQLSYASVTEAATRRRHLRRHSACLDRTEPLSAAMSKTRPTLVYPELLPYVPCARLPALRHGRVETPGYVVLSDSLLRREPERPLNAFDLNQVLYSSPFRGTFDTYQWERLSTADTPDWPLRVLVLKIDRHIAGAVRALPESVTHAA